MFLLREIKQDQRISVFSFSRASWYCWKQGTEKIIQLFVYSPIFSFLTYAEICLTLGTMIFCFPSQNPAACVRGVPAEVTGESRAVTCLVNTELTC